MLLPFICRNDIPASCDKIQLVLEKNQERPNDVMKYYEIYLPPDELKALAVEI